MSVNASYLMTVPIDVGLEIIRKLPMSEISKLFQTNKRLNDRYYRYLKADIELEQQRRYRIGKLKDANGYDDCDQDNYKRHEGQILSGVIPKMSKEDLESIVLQFLTLGLQTVEQERITIPSTSQILVK